MKCQNDLEMGDEDSFSLQPCVQLLQALLKAVHSLATSCRRPGKPSMDGIMPQVSPIRHQYDLNASTKAGSRVVFSAKDGFPFPSGG